MEPLRQKLAWYGHGQGNTFSLGSGHQSLPRIRVWNRVHLKNQERMLNHFMKLRSACDLSSPQLVFTFKCASLCLDFDFFYISLLLPSLLLLLSPFSLLSSLFSSLLLSPPLFLFLAFLLLLLLLQLLPSSSSSHSTDSSHLSPFIQLRTPAHRKLCLEACLLDDSRFCNWLPVLTIRLYQLYPESQGWISLSLFQLRSHSQCLSRHFHRGSSWSTTDTKDW